MRPLVNIQDVLHTRYKRGIFFWGYTPVIIQVRSKFRFLNITDGVLAYGRVQYHPCLFRQEAQGPAGPPLRGL